MAVDIIIPIYNAFEDLQICLESIYRHTDLKKNRLILINDKSPDERIRSYLDSQKKEGVIVIHNEENKGFSNNINIGMSQPEENDVILLNSDTVVTKRWVEKMVECAYSESYIGTVTPLSNNATLCSVPNFCEENVLPEGMTIDEMATIVEECSMKKYPRITVAHGFCMLVKREVIHAIGNFDAETFGRGYGEENDFCNRAEQMGYIHVMCDDTYILHTGTKSFVSKEKEAYIREHDRILQKRYPEQMRGNAVYCRDNPNGWVGKNIGYHMQIRNGKKNVFYLVQSDFKEGAKDNVGGTQLHVKHLTMNLRQHMNVFVAARDGDFLQVTAYTAESECTFRFHIGALPVFPVYRSRELAELFRMLLIDFRIDLVHIHHTATTSLDIYYEAEALNIPIIFTAHDFYYACPSIKMLDAQGEVCINKENLDCAACLRKKLNLYEKNAYLTMWRKEHSKVLNLCKAIIVPSESAKEILGIYYPKQVGRMKVIEHGMDKIPLVQINEKEVVVINKLKWKLEKIDKKKCCPLLAGIAYFEDEKDKQYRVVLKITDKNGQVIYLPTTFGNNADVLVSEKRFLGYLPNTILADGDIRVIPYVEKKGIYYKNKEKEEIIKNVVFQKKDNFRTAFIGGISEEKGGKIIAEIIKKGDSDIEWYVFGGIGEESLYQLKKENLVKTSYYHQEDLKSLLAYHKIDAICILSKWPETFSYTLSEAIVNDIPVIVTEIGALGQRTKKNNYGIAVSANEKKTAEEVLEEIKKWKQKGQRYQHYKSIAKDYQHVSLAQMADCYADLYEELFVEKKLPELSVSEKQIMCYAYQSGGKVYEGTPELMDKIGEMESRMRAIDNNVTIQFILRLSRIQFPYKKEIRKFLLGLMKK